MPPGENAELWKTTVRNTGDARQGADALLVRRVLPLRGAERHDELPAHVLDRRGRGRGRRRSTTRPSTASGATTTRSSAARARSPASTPRATRSSACTTGCTRRPCRSRAARTRQRRARLEPDRLAPARPAARAGRRGDASRSSSPTSSRRGAEVRAPRRREQGARARAARALRRARRGRRGVRARCGARWDGLLARFQVECPDPHATRMLNTWNQYQCMATFNLSRSASLYETGIGRGMGFRDSNQDLLGFVHLIPGARAAADPRPRRDPALRRHVLPPVPAADEAGERRDRRRLLRRPPLARPLDLRVREGDGRRVDPRRAGRLRRHARRAARACSTTSRRASRTRSRHRGPHGLPLIGHADWNDCLNLNCFSTDPDESFQTAGDVEGSRRSR